MQKTSESEIPAKRVTTKKQKLTEETKQLYQRETLGKLKNKIISQKIELNLVCKAESNKL